MTEKRWAETWFGPGCSNCDWLPPVRGGRCNACATYFYTKGVERPHHLIVKHAQRWEEKQALRAIVRRQRKD